MSHDRRRRTVTPDEARIWRAVIRDVAPLPKATPSPNSPADPPAEAAGPPPDSPAARPSPPVRAPTIRVPAGRPAAPPPPLEHGRAAGLDKSTARRMHGGDMEIDGRLDLHGMTQQAAHASLIGFVIRAFDTGRRCLLVITGKGRLGSGVLRAEVPRWLNQSPLRERVLGFSYAKPRDGGDGALYVLVKRRRT